MVRSYYTTSRDRTGYDLSPQLILELVRKHKNIVGIKDTVGTMGHTREIIQVVKKEFPGFPGIFRI